VGVAGGVSVVGCGCVAGGGGGPPPITGDWITLHNEELHKFYSSLNIVREVKFSRMMWAEHYRALQR
jgi:hypothetical protein